MDALRKDDATRALIRTIAAIARADTRPYVEVYAEIVQSDLWAGLWNAMSEDERRRVVDRARQEAGR